jgi:hypothetical protein
VCRGWTTRGRTTTAGVDAGGVYVRRTGAWYTGAWYTGAERTTVGFVTGFGFDAGAGALYGSGGGASGVVDVGVVGGGVLSARPSATQHIAATSTPIATAAARALAAGMAASLCCASLRAWPAVASGGAEIHANSRSAAVFRERAAPGAPRSRRSNDFSPRELPIAPLPGESLP